jgi:hypothetical protein
MSEVKEIKDSGCEYDLSTDQAVGPIPTRGYQCFLAVCVFVSSISKERFEGFFA